MGSETPDFDTTTIEDWSKVPEDFPRPLHMGAIGGAQPKFLTVKFQGRYYVPGATPPEIYERWILCSDLAEQLTEKSVESKAGKRSHMSEAEILEQYFIRLLHTKWTSEAEARWIITSVARKLNWNIPVLY
jgi:hypothetical protein